MNALPNYVVLDFFEWLLTNKNMEFEGIDSLFTNDNYNDIYKYARQYLSKKRTSGMSYIQNILHQYINSSAFEEAIIRSSRTFDNNSHSCQAFRVMDCIEYSDCFKGSLNRFLHDNRKDIDIDRLSVRQISPEHLVDSLRYYVSNAPDDDKTPYLNLMINSGYIDLSVEIGFLDWLQNSKSKAINLYKMPLNLFKELVNNYLMDNDVANYEKQYRQLIKSFKGSEQTTLASKLSAVLPKTKLKKLKSLHYIYDRYSNPNIKFKCFLLPLAADRNFEVFLNNYWIDLDSLSGNHLDIFYSLSELNMSGYKIKEQFIKLNVPENVLPCLVLWEDKLEDAIFIELRDLTDEEVFHLISTVVQAIKKGNKLNEIYEEARAMIDKELESKRPITNIHQTVENNTGIVAGIIEKSKIKLNSGDISHSDKFSDDVASAIEIINKITDVQQSYKDTLIDLITEARNAVQDNNENAKKSCKEKFKYFAMGAGNAIKNVLSALGSLASIAKFFNITQ